MFEPQYTITAPPPMTAKAFTSRHNAELDLRVKDIENDFGLILDVLRAADTRNDGELSVLFSVVGVGGVATKLAVSLRVYGRHDAFTVFLSPARKLAWIGDLMFWAIEPTCRTSQEFLKGVSARIDAFVEGAKSVDVYNG
ncbi:MAG: hypothetical protein WA733_10365 [Methylocystis sp.]